MEGETLHRMKWKSLFFVAVAGLLAASGSDLIAQATATSAASAALPFVSPIFGDNMVLQRGKPDAVWGWAEPGAKITVRIGGHRATGVAGPDRRWEVRIQPPKPGGPYTLEIAGPQTVAFHNVLVGDVWLCGGQSNMELPLRFTAHAEQVAKSANDPQIRYFTVAGNPAYHPAATVSGSWKAVSPATADWLSAVAFYFARSVQQKTHLPIGLVVDAVGGSPAEAWTSESALRPLKDFDVPLAELNKLAAAGAPAYGNYIMHWYDAYDIGLKGQWNAPSFDDSAWKTVQVPGGFAGLGDPVEPAVAWFRREVVLPDPLPKGPATLYLGEVERMDTVYLNGKFVGASAWVENPRVYRIPAGVLQPGRNLIAIRVFKTKPNGGFLDKPDALHLDLGNGKAIPLAGAWKGRISVDARSPHPMPIGFENWPVMPAVLSMGMIQPIDRLSIAGALWYQGEQNSERGYQYRKVLAATIGDWRSLFGQGNFPFYIVSLPAFGARSQTPTDDGWADTRESQAIVAASVPNACLAVTDDTGDANSLHPKDKEPVGDRLARCALAKYYRKHIVFSGPTLATVRRMPGAIALSFKHADGGLAVQGNKLAGFAIAGDDRQWRWADARIEGNKVIVWSPAVPHPTQVRYDWQTNPAATLFNGAGLPAGPFRTDDWPLVTQTARPY